MKAVIREIFLHLMFVLLVQLVCNASLDDNSHWLAHNAKKFMLDNAMTISYFEGQAYTMTAGVVESLERDVRTVEGEGFHLEERLHWFDWARYSLTEYLFPPGWYNGMEYPKSFVGDNAQSKVLAMARVRQLRIRPRLCEKHKVFEHLIVECNVPYSGTNEWKSNHSARWQPPFNKTMLYRLRRGKRTSVWKGLEDPWLNQDGGEIQALPYPGRFATYGGDSYSVSIGPKKKVAKLILENLRKHFWIDRYTRALFTEANIYNANTNLLLRVTVLHEILPTGGWNYWYDIQALRLYRYVGGMGDIVILFDLIFVFSTLVAWYNVLKYARREGFKEYVMNIWNIFHVAVTICSTLAIILFLVRLMLVRTQVQFYNDNPERFVSFAVVGQVEYIIMTCMGIVAFISTCQFLKILRFNKIIAQLLETCAILTPGIASWLIAFVIIFMAYSVFAHCLFVDKLQGYRSVKYSLVTLTLMFMGHFDLGEFIKNAPVFGVIFFFSYMIVITMIMINLFVGIICDAYAGVVEEQAEDDDEDNIGTALLSAVQNVKARRGLFEEAPQYRESLNKWETFMNKVDDTTNDVQYLLHTMEIEEIRQQQWLQSNEDNHRTWCLVMAVCGVGVLEYEEEFFNGIPELSRHLKTMSSSEAQRFLLAAAALRESGDITNPFPKPIENIGEDNPTSTELNGIYYHPYLPHTSGDTPTSSDGESNLDSEDLSTLIDRTDEEASVGESDGMNLSSYLRTLAEDDTWVSAVGEREEIVKKNNLNENNDDIFNSNENIDAPTAAGTEFDDSIDDIENIDEHTLDDSKENNNTFSYGANQEANNNGDEEIPERQGVKHTVTVLRKNVSFNEEEIEMTNLEGLFGRNESSLSPLPSQPDNGEDQKEGEEAGEEEEAEEKKTVVSITEHFLQTAMSKEKPPPSRASTTTPATTRSSGYSSEAVSPTDSIPDALP